MFPYDTRGFSCSDSTLVSTVTVVVFAGPSVSPEDCRAIYADVVTLPPARLGDIDLAVRSNPRAIGICDAALNEDWNELKAEVTAALEAGMPVYGSAAVGAIWAAELESNGMVGVGFVFEQYKRGALRHRSEIVVSHGSGGDGYSPSSEALVNIWATLDQALEVGVISAGVGEVLRRLAAALEVSSRTYAQLLLQAATEGVEKAQLASLERYLRSHLPVNHQRRDALTMLTRIRDDLPPSSGSPASSKQHGRLRN